MLMFHLKKEWFEKVKSGEKTHEYRVCNKYWTKRIYKHFHLDTYVYIPPDRNIVFALGYPVKKDKEKMIKAIVKRVRIIDGKNTDLKYNGKVFDIKFELLGEK